MQTNMIRFFLLTYFIFFSFDSFCQKNIDLVNLKKKGYTIKLYPNGKTKSVEQWKNKRLLNVAVIFDGNNNQLPIGSLKNGNGYIYSYYYSDTLLSPMDYFYEDSLCYVNKIKQNQEYKNGLVYGKYINYYPNGIVESEGLRYQKEDLSSYQMLIIGKYKEYENNGMLKSVLCYDNYGKHTYSINYNGLGIVSSIDSIVSQDVIPESIYIDSNLLKHQTVWKLYPAEKLRQQITYLKEKRGNVFDNLNLKKMLNMLSVYDTIKYPIFLNDEKIIITEEIEESIITEKEDLVAISKNTNVEFEEVYQGIRQYIRDISEYNDYNIIHEASKELLTNENKLGEISSFRQCIDLKLDSLILYNKTRDTAISIIWGSLGCEQRQFRAIVELVLCVKVKSGNWIFIRGYTNGFVLHEKGEIKNEHDIRREIYITIGIAGFYDYIKKSISGIFVSDYVKNSWELGKKIDKFVIDIYKGAVKF